MADTRLTLTVRPDPDAGRQIGTQLARILRQTAPARPIVPRPLWQRDDLFREPQFPEGFGVLEDDDGDDGNAV